MITRLVIVLQRVALNNQAGIALDSFTVALDSYTVALYGHGGLIAQQGHISLKTNLYLSPF